MTEHGADTLTAIVRSVIDRMQVGGEVTAVAAEEGASLAVNIQVPNDARFLIGRDGQNVRALEHVIRLIWARRDSSGRAVTVDVNDYRKTRVAEIVARVHDAARRVRDTSRSEALDPMTSYERRIVHTELATYHDLATESIGQEPHRRVVIKPL